MSLTKLSLAGYECMINVFPARGSLVSDLPAADGKIVKPFFTVQGKSHNFCMQCNEIIRYWRGETACLTSLMELASSDWRPGMVRNESARQNSL
jgi:hypothetical protein